jgi:hypothetical protein
MKNRITELDASPCRWGNMKPSWCVCVWIEIQQISIPYIFRVAWITLTVCIGSVQVADKTLSTCRPSGGRSSTTTARRTQRRGTTQLHPTTR